MFEGELAPLYPSQKDLISKFESWLRLEVAHGDPSLNTLVSYLGSTRTFLRWCSSFGVDECLAGPDDIKRYRASLVSEGYSRRTIQSRLVGVRHFYSAINSWGWREENPAAEISAKRELTSRTDFIIAKYIPDKDAFLNLYKLPDSSSEKGLRDCAILRVLCFTGIRICELCGLNIEDIECGINPEMIVRRGKGRKQRRVPLSQPDVVVLKSWISRRERVRESDGRSLFIALDNCSRGKRLSTRSARRVVDEYLRRSGLKKPGRSCHALRHSAATWLLDAGVPTEAIADILGHSSTSITAIYAKVVDHRKFTPGDVLNP